MRRNVHLWVLVGCSLLPATALAQPCPVPCNGTQVNCTHQNGIRNAIGAPFAVLGPLTGPNGAAPAGNVVGDAEWKVWGCENGMTRASGVHTVTNWQLVLLNNLPGAAGAVLEIPDMELRSVLLGAAGTRIPDVNAPALAAFALPSLTLPIGVFNVNVSIGQGVAILATCTPPVGLPTLPNADTALLFLYPPGQIVGPGYVFQVQTQNETTAISNGGNSYSGTYDAVTGAFASYAPNQELYGELGFFEPVLEALRQTPAFAAPTTGAGSREFAAGDIAVLRSLDWGAGVAAVNGQNRFAAVLFSDPSGGNPFCQPPGTPGFLQGSLFLPGSAGVVALFPTALTANLINWSAWSGNGMNCHVLNAPCGVAGVPSVFSDMVADTAPVLVPPGLTGTLLHAATLYVNLTTLSIEDGSNTVELNF